MHPDLTRFLKKNSSFHEGPIQWGETELLLRCFLTAEMPPLSLVSSARAVVIQRGQVLVIRDKATEEQAVEAQAILPGGRLEEGESPEEALAREMAEETGWEVERKGIIGALQLHHLSPKPEDHKYPYPDFMHVIYRASAKRKIPESEQLEPPEYECWFEERALLTLDNLESWMLSFADAALD